MNMADGSAKFKELLDFAVTRDGAACVQAFNSIRDLIRRSAIETLLYRVALGEIPVIKAGDVYFIVHEQREITSLQSYLNACQTRLQVLLSKNSPVLLVELVNTSHRSYSIASIPGFGYVHLSVAELPPSGSETQIITAGLRVAISHELGHCFLYSGNRFLDEGFATYAESWCETRPSAVEMENEPLRTLPTLRTILSTDLADQHTLDTISPANPVWAYQKAARLIDFIITQLGAETLVAIFNHPLVSSCKTAAGVLESATGKSLEDIERIIGDENTPKTELVALTTEDQALLHLVRLAYLKLDSAACREKISVLASLAEKYHDSAEVLECVIKAKTSWFLSDSFGASLAPSQQIPFYSELCSDIQLYVSRYKDTANSAFFGIVSEVISLKSAYRHQRYMEIDMILKNCRDKLNLARRQYANDIDLLLCEAHFVNETPEQYGGGAKAALAILRSIEVDSGAELYPAVRYWLRKYSESIHSNINNEIADEDDDEFFIVGIKE